MIEACANPTQAIPTIKSLAELEGYMEGLREFRAHVTDDERRQLAMMKIEFEKRVLK